MRLVAAINHLQPHAENPAIAKIIKDLGSYHSDTSGSSTRYTPDPLELIFVSQRSKLLTVFTDSEDEALVNAAHKALLELAYYRPRNETDRITEKPIPENKLVVVASGHHFHISTLICYQKLREYRSRWGENDENEGRVLLNTITRAKFHPLDAARIRQIATDKGLEVLPDPAPRSPASSPRSTSPARAIQQRGDSPLQQNRHAMRLVATINHLQPHAENPAIANIIKNLGSYHSDASGSSTRYTPDTLKLIFVSQWSKLLTVFTDSENEALVNAAHKALLELAYYHPRNETDPNTLEPIDENKLVVVASGHHFDIETLINYQKQREYNSRWGENDENEGRVLLNPITRDKLHPLDAARIRQIAKDKGFEALPDPAPRDPASPPRNASPARLIQQRGDSPLAPDRHYIDRPQPVQNATLETALDHVVWSEIDEAEAILRPHQEWVFEKAAIEDPRKYRFPSISPLQYPYHAKDTHMLRMLFRLLGAQGDAASRAKALFESLPNDDLKRRIALSCAEIDNGEVNYQEGNGAPTPCYHYDASAFKQSYSTFIETAKNEFEKPLEQWNYNLLDRLLTAIGKQQERTVTHYAEDYQARQQWDVWDTDELERYLSLRPQGRFAREDWYCFRAAGCGARVSDSRSEYWHGAVAVSFLGKRGVLRVALDGEALAVVDKVRNEECEELKVAMQQVLSPVARP